MRLDNTCFLGTSLFEYLFDDMVTPKPITITRLELQ